MTSLFYGLETARSGLNASQNGINITSQNQANANTEGYTRQVLNQLAQGPGLGADRYLLSGPQVGEGVNLTGVVQIRNTFLDTRYRTQNSENSEMQQLQSGLTDVASIVNEISSTSSTTLVGISGQLSSLLNSLQTYSSTPDDANLPQTVKASFSTLCQTIRSDYSRIQQLEEQDKQDLKTTVEGNDGKGGINEILSEISSLNRQISAYEITGQSANDLRDQRNLDLDKLSGYVDIDVSEQSNGMVVVKLHSDSTSGNALIAADNTVTGLKMNGDNTGVEWDDGSSTPATIKGGSVAGALMVINGTGTGTGDYGDFGIQAMYQKLNDFTNSLVAIVNGNVPSGGKPLLDISSNTSEPAAVVDLSSDWKSDDSLFADNCTGADKGSYILAYKTALGTTKMSDLTSFSGVVSYGGSLQDYADTISTDISYQVNYYTSQAESSSSQLSSLDTERKSVSSVSSDDEAINTIKYSQSYSACARVITAIDEMLDKLINGTGLVGLS